MDVILIFAYYSGKTGNLVPIVSEQYGLSKVRYYAVAAVKRANRDVNITTHKGKKSCHTGTRPRNAGWNIPIGFLLSSKIIPEVACGNMNHDLISAGKFFNQSCVPGKCYSPPGGGGGGEGGLKEVLQGEATPQLPTPFPFIYHFYRKGTPSVYTFYLQMVRLSHTWFQAQYFSYQKVFLSLSHP